MKKLLALVLIGAFVLSAALPALAYYPGTSELEFAMQINGQWSNAANPVVLTGIQYCNTIEVDVWAMGAVDLYAYDFRMGWNTAYLSLVNVTLIHNPPFATDFVLPVTGVKPGGFYEQAVTATAPTPGFTGDAMLTKMFFHIQNDAEWNEPITLIFTMGPSAASDSSTTAIEHSQQEAFLKLTPVQPSIDLDLGAITHESVNGTVFTVQVTLHNIVRMKSFHLYLSWDNTQLSTDAQNVFIKSFLPPPYEIATIVFGHGVGTWDFVKLDVQIPCEKPSINGTGELFGVRFMAIEPTTWAAPSIPGYAFADPVPPQTHGTWYPIPCWNYINLGGTIDKKEVDGSIVLQNLGTDIKVIGPNINPLNPPTYKISGTGATVTNVACGDGVGGYIAGYYEFRAIPGDLNLDGHTDVVDLAAIAAVFGRNHLDGLTPLWGAITGFDLDGSGYIDLADIVIVAKNICAVTPDPINPWPLFG